MTRNWTPRDALIDVLMKHLYVWAPGEAEARRIIEGMADAMLQDMEGTGYAIVPVEPGALPPPGNLEPDAGRAH